jgi:hypothetical protein
LSRRRSELVHQSKHVELCPTLYDQAVAELEQKHLRYADTTTCSLDTEKRSGVGGGRRNAAGDKIAFGKDAFDILEPVWKCSASPDDDRLDLSAAREISSRKVANRFRSIVSVHRVRVAAAPNVSMLSKHDLLVSLDL